MASSRSSRISSKKEYLESAWVRSEWERWINFIKKDVKEKNSLYLYIPQGSHFELPNILHKTQIFNDTLELVKRIVGVPTPPIIEVKETIEEKLVKAKNSLLFGDINESENQYKEIISEYPKDYRSWLGLVEVLVEKEVKSNDKRYKRFINQAIKLCDDENIKNDILKTYDCYLKDQFVEEIKEEKNEKELNVKTDTSITAEDNEELEYELNADKKSYSVKGIGTCKSSTITIKGIYNGLPVTTIQKKAFYLNEFIKKVYIEDNIQIINERAFYQCANLEEIRLPNTLKKIEYGAFYFNKLKTLNLPEGLEHVGGQRKRLKP